jgi:diguanylate cyclase (GGDEF)-like protein
MDDKHEVFTQIAHTLAKHFDSMYYIDIETGHYSEFVSMKIFEDIDFPKQGKNFFYEFIDNAPLFVHSDDIEKVNRIYNKSAMLEKLSKNYTYSDNFRILINGIIIHMRHVGVMCEDKRHVLCCLENVEAEYLKKEEQERNLKSAERMARRDELTGIRNKNAFKEYYEAIDEKIKSGEKDYQFAMVMCDVNDLKHINDTRGHHFGDEVIQTASRIICEIYDHSPVFRIGGDEFVIILTDRDYEDRDLLIDKLKEESIVNGYSRSGPVIACGMAVYEQGVDGGFDMVFERADKLMYQNKKELKSSQTRAGFMNMKKLDNPIPPERKRKLDAMFGALYTVAGEGYVYLNDMRYDFSRWSLPLVHDFNVSSEYMYHADSFLQECVHPDDVAIYRKAVDATLCGNAQVQPIRYRARLADGTYVLCYTRGFILSDSNGDPEYFGGVIITQ